MIDIAVNNLIKSYEIGDNVLDGLSFSINEGEKIAILGHNGCGKTTLFKILTGAIDYDDGTVTIAPKKKIGLISQIPNFPYGWNVEDVLKSANHEIDAVKNKMREIENDFTEDKLKEYDRLTAEYERLGGYNVETVINKVANGLDVTNLRNKPFEILSGGEKTRVNLARLIIENTDILLLDEPTNHLDLNATMWLEEYISKFKGTVLTISHDRFFLDKVVNKCIDISSGKAEFYSGNYSFFIEERQRRFDEKMKQYEKDTAKIEQLTKAAEQMHLWAFMGMDKLHKRAFSMEKRIEKLKTTEKPVQAKQLTIKFKEADFSGDEVLDVVSLSKRYGDKVLFDDLSFEIVGSESVAIIGDNGTGKSTLLKVLMNQEEANCGRIRIAPQVKTAYLPQAVEFNDEQRSAYDTMLYETNCTPQQARDRLAMFGFRGDSVKTMVGALSGGERSRLKLCMLMGSDINLLILDEPTNHLDIASREWIESSLLEYDKTLLFVSHDRYFIDKFATRILSFDGNGKVTDYKGTYKEYCEYKSRETVYDKISAPKKEKGTKEKRISNNLGKIERQIEKLEEKINALELLATENSTDYIKLMEIDKEKTAVAEELEKLYEQWADN